MASLQLILDLLGRLGQGLNERTQDIGLAGHVVALRRSQPALGQDVTEPPQLVGRPGVALAQLVEDADVVLGVLVLGALLELGGDLIDLLGDLGEVGARQLGDDGVEGGDGAGRVVEAAAGEPVRAGLLVDVGEEVGLGAAALVEDAVLATRGEELDGRVRGDAVGLGGGLAVGGVGVDLGDQDVVVACVVGGNALPDGGEVLAVWG